MVERKEIQEQRMKGYFIQATKDILKGEGLRAISVRNIADRAGYSYATLYNYFSDVKDLIFECVKDFQDEAREFIAAETKNSEPGLDKVELITQAYMKYFIQYPGIFELFYIEKTSEVAQNQQNIEVIYDFLDRLLEEEWRYCINEGIVSSEEAEIKGQQLQYTVLGMLLLYITRKYPASYTEFKQIAEQQIDQILYLK